ncbi:MAG: hypothetical protein JO168_24910 [Solirubrobacterales bacterium]|nr:hypothetical protein [Solirubrobacterales bacterium]
MIRRVDRPPHADPTRTTILEIYAQVLKRRDRRRHGEAFDALMADAIPSAASINDANKLRPLGRPRRARFATLSDGSAGKSRICGQRRSSKQ